MKQKKSVTAALILLLGLMCLCNPALLWAQETQAPSPAPETATAGDAEAAAAAEEAPPGGEAPQGMSIFELIKKGGIIGYLIILLSFIALGLVLDYAFTIRKSKLAPQRDITLLKKLIRDGKFEEIQSLNQGNTSFLSRVVIAGLKETAHGYAAMIKAMEDTAEALSARLARKIEHLNVIGNISPMLGLLGTVVGMLRCFNEISRLTTAIEPRQLAGGIFEALVTTCMGLVVAIPALYFYAIFRNRLDEYTGEASLAAEELVSALKPESRTE